MLLSETQLIADLKTGNQESFTLLFELYHKKIYNLAFKMCGNREDSEDIVQKTFIRAITYINGFKEESSIYTWLYSITKNLCLKLFEERKRSSFSSLEEVISKTESLASPHDLSVFEKQYYIGQVKEGCLLGLLRCLSFHQRIAFILNVLLEVKVKAVAIVIGKTETATRLLIHRAKKNLKNFLCKNCSYYDASNSCYCENLINFSIQQGWIQKRSIENITLKPNNTIETVESEIDSLEKVVRIYNTLEEHQPLETRVSILKEEITKQTFKIFNDKKVK